MPLAIELAAARLNMFSVKALAAKLGDRLGMLSGGERTADPRLQTMRATIDWSYGLLSGPEQRVFERLSIFTGGCTLDGATNVCASEDVGKGDVVDLLASLVDKSLVVVELEGPEPRYRLLESFRQYAHEGLVARGEDQVVAFRHAVACLDLVDSASGLQECEPRDRLAGLCFGNSTTCAPHLNGRCANGMTCSWASDWRARRRPGRRSSTRTGKAGLPQRATSLTKKRQGRCSRHCIMRKRLSLRTFSRTT